MIQRTSLPGRRRHRATGAMAAVFSTLLLAGCSWTPDWANPVEWYDGVAGWFGDDDPQAKQAREQAKAKEKQTTGGTFPNLSTVPDRPKDIATTAQAGRVQDGLVADRSQARHAAVNPSSSGPGAPPPPVIASPPPPPAAVGRVPAGPVPPVAAPPPYAPARSATPSGLPQAPPAPQIVASEPRAQMMPAEPPTPAMVEAPDQAQLRSAFESALAQSGGVVAQPASGIRDANKSNVVARGAVRNPLPMPPSERNQVALRAPPIADAGTFVGARGPGAPAATVLFDNNSSRLSGDDLRLLENIVNMKKGRAGVLRVVGHASSRTKDLDPVRHRLINFRLSLARANAVAAALVKMGIPAKDVAVEARADNEPVYHEVMPAGEAANRRAEIYLDY